MRQILEYNGRAHLEDEIHRAYGWARDLGFDQINIDLIAGMVGETWDNWRRLRAPRRIALAPDSVTIYQMELPFNTVFSQGAADRRPGRAGRRPGRRLADQARLGELRLRRRCGRPATRCPAPTRWSRTSSEVPVRLPRQPVARGRHVRHRRRLVRPRPRRPHAERRYLGAVRRHARPRRTAAGPGPAGDAAPAADPRDDPAAEDRPAGGRRTSERKFGVGYSGGLRGRLPRAGGRRLPDADGRTAWS